MTYLLCKTHTNDSITCTASVVVAVFYMPLEMIESSWKVVHGILILVI